MLFIFSCNCNYLNNPLQTSDMARLTVAQNTAWHGFLRMHKILLDQTEQALKRANLPELSWYDVLWALEESSGHRLRLHELADRLVLQRSNLTRLIDRMVKAGLVARESCERDHRGAFATITAEGLVMREAIWKVYSGSIYLHFAQKLSSEQIVLLNQIFNELSQDVEI